MYLHVVVLLLLRLPIIHDPKLFWLDQWSENIKTVDNNKPWTRTDNAPCLCCFFGWYSFQMGRFSRGWQVWSLMSGNNGRLHQVWKADWVITSLSENRALNFACSLCAILCAHSRDKGRVVMLSGIIKRGRSGSTLNAIYSSNVLTRLHCVIKYGNGQCALSVPVTTTTGADHCWSVMDCTELEYDPRHCTRFSYGLWRWLSSDPRVKTKETEKWKICPELLCISARYFSSNIIISLNLVRYKFSVTLFNVAEGYCAVTKSVFFCIAAHLSGWAICGLSLSREIGTCKFVVRHTFATDQAHLISVTSRLIPDWSASLYIRFKMENMKLIRSVWSWLILVQTKVHFVLLFEW